MSTNINDLLSSATGEAIPLVSWVHDTNRLTYTINASEVYEIFKDIQKTADVNSRNLALGAYFAMLNNVATQVTNHLRNNRFDQIKTMDTDEYCYYNMLSAIQNRNNGNTEDDIEAYVDTLTDEIFRSLFDAAKVEVQYSVLNKIQSYIKSGVTGNVSDNVVNIFNTPISGTPNLDAALAQGDIDIEFGPQEMWELYHYCFNIKDERDAAVALEILREALEHNAHKVVQYIETHGTGEGRLIDQPYMKSYVGAITAVLNMNHDSKLNRVMSLMDVLVNNAQAYEVSLYCKYDIKMLNSRHLVMMWLDDMQSRNPNDPQCVGFTQLQYLQSEFVLGCLANPTYSEQYTMYGQILLQAACAMQSYLRNVIEDSDGPMDSYESVLVSLTKVIKSYQDGQCTIEELSNTVLNNDMSLWLVDFARCSATSECVDSIYSALKSIQRATISRMLGSSNNQQTSSGNDAAQSSKQINTAPGYVLLYAPDMWELFYYGMNIVGNDKVSAMEILDSIFRYNIQRVISYIERNSQDGSLSVNNSTAEEYVRVLKSSIDEEAQDESEVTRVIEMATSLLNPDMYSLIDACGLEAKRTDIKQVCVMWLDDSTYRSSQGTPIMSYRQITYLWKQLTEGCLCGDGVYKDYTREYNMFGQLILSVADKLIAYISGRIPDKQYGGFDWQNRYLRQLQDAFNGFQNGFITVKDLTEAVLNDEHAVSIIDVAQCTVNSGYLDSIYNRLRSIEGNAISNMLK